MRPARLLLPGALALLSLALSATAHAGRATIEFSKNSENPGSSPTNLTVANDRLYFAADDGLHGVELWQVDRAGVAGLACDLNVGAAGSNPRSIVGIGEYPCFLGDYPDDRGVLSPFLGCLDRPGTHGHAVTPGYLPNPLLSDPSFCARVQGMLFIDCVSPQNGRELWRLKPGPAHFSLVCDTIPGPHSGLSVEAQAAVALKGKLLFKAECPYDPLPGSQRLWVSDGTSRGTFSLLPEPPIPEGKDHGEPHYVTVVGDRAFFMGARDHLWVTDGSREGTREVKAVSVPREFCEFKGVVYFQADDGEHGSELWRTDGTSQGTWLVKDINPGPALSGPFLLRDLGEFFLFSADDGVHGYEQWRSDGTAEGTRLVKDIYKGPTSSNLYQPTVYGDSLLFAADHPQFGEELWRSDGTEEGTRLVRDIHEGLGLSEPYSLTVFNDYVYFCANDGVHGEELWRTDGTEAGTVLAADVNPARRFVRSSNPTSLCAGDGIVFFSADDVTHGAELWVFDGRTLDTRLVKDVNPGPAHADPEELTLIGDLLFFTGDDGANGRGLWASDGTQDGTERVIVWPNSVDVASVDHLTRVAQTLLLVATDVDGDEHVCRLAPPYQLPEVTHTLDGTMKRGAAQRIVSRDSTVRICVECADSQYRFLVSQDTGNSFAPSSVAIPIPGTWESVRRMALSGEDGLGEELLACYLATPAMTGTRSVRWHDEVYFAGYMPNSGVELWCSGNGPKQAKLVKDLLPGRGSGSPDELTVYRDKLYFAAEHGTNGRELWSSDGTGSGTVCVQDLAAGRSGGNPKELTLVEDKLVFVVRRPPTQDGAPYLAYLNPLGVIESVTGNARHAGVWPTHPAALTVMNDGFIYFSGRGLGSGAELWRTTGSAWGTEMVRNILDDTSYDACTELWRHRSGAIAP
jgi:large repetitive protein